MRIRLFAALLALAWLAPASAPAAPAAARPRLVVALLFDQYRGDLLERYRPVFGRGGFLRLMDGGATFTDCTIPYAITFTGPGHASWLSGAPPSVHGIVSNGWYDRIERRFVACVQDSSYASVGLGGPANGEVASPRRMRAQTVADVLRRETLGRSKVIALSDKARGAVLPAGRHPDGVYWMDGRTGLYQTSTYYAPTLPAWLVLENERRAAKLEAARGTAWTPRASLARSLFAGTVEDSIDRFPHRLVLPVGKAGGELKVTVPDVAVTHHPLDVEGLFDLARAALDGEQLGADDTPDLLIISLSGTDRVGHAFGPDSPEALDFASRVDSTLGVFLSLLDTKVGKGRWTAVVTADHGVTPNPETARRFEAAPFDTVGAVSSTAIREWVNRVVGGSAKGLKKVTLSIDSGNVVFDPVALDSLALTRVAAARIVADSALACTFFLRGYTEDELKLAGPGDPLRMRAAMGWFPGRSGDVLLMPANDVFYEDGKRYRGGHGGPQRDQRLVPFVLYGMGVKSGTFREPVSFLDIAPTVARLFGIEPPAQCEGQARYEALAP